MKRLSLLFLFFASLSFGQYSKENINKLKNELKSSNLSFERKASVYADLTWEYMEISLDSANVYGEQALFFANKTQRVDLISQSYSILGDIHILKSDFDKAEEYYLMGLKIKKVNRDHEGVASSNINLGYVFAGKKDYVAAKTHFIDALTYFKKSKNEVKISFVEGKLGLVYFELKDYPNAIKYLEESAFFLEKENIEQGLCATYLSLGDVYANLKNSKKALSYYKKSLTKCSACKDDLSSLLVNKRLEAFYHEDKKSKVAEKYKSISEQLANELNKSSDQSNVLLSNSQALIESKQYAKAQDLLLKIKAMPEQNESISQILDVTKQLALVFLLQNNKDSSASYFNRYNVLKEKKIQVFLLKQTSKMESKSKIAENEKRLSQEIEERNSKIKMITILVLSVLGIAIVGFLIYRQRELKK